MKITIIKIKDNAWGGRRVVGTKVVEKRRCVLHNSWPESNRYHLQSIRYEYAIVFGININCL